MIFCVKCGGLISNPYLPDYEGKWCTCVDKNKHTENSEKSENSEIIKLLNEILAEIKGIKN